MKVLVTMRRSQDITFQISVPDGSSWEETQQEATRVSLYEFTPAYTREAAELVFSHELLKVEHVETPNG